MIDRIEQLTKWYKLRYGKEPDMDVSDIQQLWLNCLEEDFEAGMDNYFNKVVEEYEEFNNSLEKDDWRKKMINYNLMQELRAKVKNGKSDKEVMAAARELVMADDGCTYANYSVGAYAFGHVYTLFFINVKYPNKLDTNIVDAKVRQYIKETMSALELTQVEISDVEYDSSITDFDLIIEEENYGTK